MTSTKQNRGQLLRTYYPRFVHYIEQILPTMDTAEMQRMITWEAVDLAQWMHKNLLPFKDELRGLGDGNSRDDIIGTCNFILQHLDPTQHDPIMKLSKEQLLKVVKYLQLFIDLLVAE